MSAMNRRTFVTSSAAALAGVTRATRAEEPARSKTKIKIGQIGVGHAHATKLAVYRRSDDYEVVGLAEPDAELRRRAESQPAFQGVPWMTTEQLLNVPGLQAVLVETRVRDLLDVAETCIAAGKHVHIDKPAGQSLAQYRRILEAADKQKQFVQMGYMYRYNPGVVLLRDVLSRGWLGEPFEVVAVMSKVVSPADRLRLAEFPGGMMFELGCHVIDLVVGILGKPDRVTAFPRHTSPDDGLVDNMLAVLEYPRATTTVRATALEVDGFARRQLTVCGTGGTFHVQPLDEPTVRATFAAPHGEYRAGYQDLHVGKYERYVGDAADMAAILRGEKESHFSYDHDLAVQETVLRAAGMPVS
ncbi:MAG TPA: Gfo/Idh/MocA family oxidoreductase [Pirellulales bacterium]|nr:Gfo/Idh/MocA family oxidoreductase [Pirellulales bacterium]